jgi:type IV secretion system protein VirD4
MKQRERRAIDLVLVLAIAAIAVPVITVWLAGVLAGLLSSGTPVTLSLSSALAVAVALPAHTAHPATAWPASSRALLPGSLALQITLALCATAVLAALAGVRAVVARRLHRRQRDRAARFASSSELSDLHATAAQAGRITLGEHDGRLIAAERRASVLCVGPAQSGKTTGLIIPAVLEWQGPVVATSVKADVVHETHRARRQLGEVLIFDPTGCTNLDHTPWSPIATARTWEGARRTAANLLGVADQGAGQNNEETFWKPAGARYLAPLLLAAAHADLTMRDVLRWVASMNQDEPTLLLKDCPNPGAQPGLEALQSVWAADHRLRSSLMQTVATGLDAWQEPAIARATAGENQISAKRLLDGRNTLYLIAPAHEQRRLRGLFTALVADVTAAAFERSASTGQPIDPPLLLALDEVANIAPLANLDEIASTGPGQGVQLLTVVQNISQAADRWGRDRAETIIANHRARLFCSGIGDRATLDYLSQTLGEEEISRIATHRENALATGSRTYSTEFRSLAAPHRIRQADTNTALLVYGRLAPAWVALRPWYADEQLRQLVQNGTATPPTPLAARPLSAAVRALSRASRRATAR